MEEAAVKIDGASGGGSGTVVGWDKDGGALVLTAAHVTAAVGDRFTVTFGDGGGGSGTALDSDAEADLALVSVPRPLPVMAVTVAAADPAKGEKVWKVGFPGDEGRALHVGTGPFLFRDRDVLFFNVRFRPGDSGGGVFNGKGQVVAVVSAFVNENPGVGIGGGTAAIRRLMGKACWPRRKAAPPKAPKGAAPKELPPVGADTDPPAAPEARPLVPPPDWHAKLEEVRKSVDALKGIVEAGKSARQDIEELRGLVAGLKNRPAAPAPELAPIKADLAQHAGRLDRVDGVLEKLAPLVADAAERAVAAHGHADAAHGKIAKVAGDVAPLAAKVAEFAPAVEKAGGLAAWAGWLPVIAGGAATGPLGIALAALALLRKGRQLAGGVAAAHAPAVPSTSAPAAQAGQHAPAPPGYFEKTVLIDRPAATRVIEDKIYQSVPCPCGECVAKSTAEDELVKRNPGMAETFNTRNKMAQQLKPLKAA